MPEAKPQTDVENANTDLVKKEKEKRPKWLTRSMADKFPRRVILITTFKEAFLFLIFVIAVSIYTIGRRNPSMFYLTQAIKGQFLDRQFKNVDDVDISFNDIRAATDFWQYASTLLMESFYSETFYDNVAPVAETKPDEKKILFENKLLGVPRIRQVKMPNNSCVVHELFTDLFTACYATYHESQEDKTSFGLGEGTAWNYNAPDETRSASSSGKISTYSGGGYYQDLGVNKNQSIDLIENLKQNLWITRGTRSVFVDFSVYNANLNLFCICKLIFEFPPTGGVLTSHTFRAVQLIFYINKWDYVTLVCEWSVYVMALFYLSEELRELHYFKYKYFFQFWSYIDMVIIVMAWGNLFTSVIMFPNVDDQIEIIKSNPDKYGNMEYLGEMKTLYNNFAASLLFFTYIKIFKYLNFNKIMGQLNNTLKRCALDIFGFSIMFFIIFFAFAELGYLLFGSQVEDFSGFGIAMFTLLRTILGDFDYQAIERANKFLAPMYFLSYIFFVFFVLLNMFLAIINDTYADVKTEIAIAPDEMQMFEFIKTEIYNFLQRFGVKFSFSTVQKSGANATLNQIRDALKKCGFSDLEIEMFFARYNIDPIAEMGAYDLKSILKELEAHSTAIDTSEDNSLVQINDFMAQQDRLVMIEQSVIKLATQVDMLIKKLEELDQIRKAKAPK